ncbi:MAG: hypothetical protein RIS35_1866, partial [Pseudomonadota bacterium]
IVFGLVLTGAIAIHLEARTREEANRLLEATARRIAARLVADLREREREVVALTFLIERTGRSEPAAVRELLDGLKQRRPDYAWIGLADAGGVVLAASDGLLEGRSVASRPWFEAGLKGRFVGDPHEAVLLAAHMNPQGKGEPLRFVDVAVPMDGESEGRRGVLGAHLHWHWAREVIDAVLRESPSDAAIEVLIADRERHWLMKPVTEPAPDLAALDAAQQSGNRYLSARAGGGASGVDALGWVVLARQDHDQVLATVRSTRWLLAGLSLTAALAFATLSWLIAGRTVRPVVRLAERARAYRAGSPNPFGVVPTPDGDEVRVLETVLRDLVDDLQVRANALRALNEDLARRVDLRTTELREANARLEEARRLAEAATEAKSAFLADMSHEIRTPLNAVIGLSHLLARSGLDTRQQDYLRKIQSSSRHLLAILNDILDFSKIEARRLQLDRVAFDLPTVLGDVGGLMEDRLQARGLRFTVRVGPEIPERLVGDPLRIGQILLNFIGNAVKFTEKGGIELRVSEMGSAAGGQRLLRFSVRDTGVGISPEKAAELFQDFRQADASVARTHGGTGLGLAISKRLAELMGGEIGVDSVPGEGSTFWFTCLLTPAEGAADSDVSMAGPARVAPTPLSNDLRGGLRRVPELVGVRAFLVDDDDLNREVGAELLRELGLEVLVARDGAEAISRLRAERPDVVLMDMQMPVMDGVTATRAIRSLQGFEKIPVLAMTANATIEDRQKCLDAGMNDHLAKPIDPDLLASALLRWIPVSRHRRRESDPPVEPGAPVDAAAGFRIEGLDPEVGLRQALGRPSLYRRLLGSLVSGQADTTARIVEAVSGARWAEAERL